MNSCDHRREKQCRSSWHDIDQKVVFHVSLGDLVVLRRCCRFACACSPSAFAECPCTACIGGTSGRTRRADRRSGATHSCSSHMGTSACTYVQRHAQCRSQRSPVCQQLRLKHAVKCYVRRDLAVLRAGREDFNYTRTTSGLNAHWVPVVVIQIVHWPSRHGWSFYVKSGSTGWTVLLEKRPHICQRSYASVFAFVSTEHACPQCVLAFPAPKTNGKPLARRYLVHVADALDTGYANVSSCIYFWFKCVRCVLAHDQCCVHLGYRSDARTHIACKANRTLMNVSTDLC